LRQTFINDHDRFFDPRIVDPEQGSAHPKVPARPCLLVVGREQDPESSSLLHGDLKMPDIGNGKNRLFDLVLEALNEAKGTRSKLTVKLLEMVLLNEMEQTGTGTVVPMTSWQVEVG
jgi:hypothetical protein